MPQGKARGPRENDPMKGFEDALKDALAKAKGDTTLYGKTCKVEFRAEITKNPGDVGWYIVDISP